MVDLIIVPCVVMGFLLGAISGLTPGIHVNNFASMLLALSPILMDNGLLPYHIASMILAASISQTFFDTIPAIFVGAPDADTALSVLPGHSLVLEGRAIEAVRLSALGSVGSITFALLLVYPLSAIFSSCYSYLMRYIGVLLLGIALLMIKGEMGPQVEGQGSLVHLKYKALAALLFVTSGYLGSFSFNHQDLLQSPLGFEPEALLPLLSGIFGASFLILSLCSESRIPEQRETDVKIPLNALTKSVIAGGFGGSVVAWIPGVSPAVATITMRLGVPSSAEEFLVSIAGVNTSNALFSLVALYAVDRPRSGAVAAVQKLITVDQNVLLQMMVIIIAVAAASYIAVILSARFAARMIPRLNYRVLCLCVLAGLTAMCLLFTGWFGLFIFFISTVVGLIAPIAGIHKTHAMGVLMVPLIIHYL
ncbi:MAG: tripartite tricarboxylate transporter permease [Methanotrichaceae archaeon]